MPPFKTGNGKGCLLGSSQCKNKNKGSLVQIYYELWDGGCGLFKWLAISQWGATWLHRYPAHETSLWGMQCRVLWQLSKGSQTGLQSITPASAVPPYWVLPRSALSSHASPATGSQNSVVNIKKKKPSLAFPFFLWNLSWPLLSMSWMTDGFWPLPRVLCLQ